MKSLTLCMAMAALIFAHAWAADTSAPSNAAPNAPMTGSPPTATTAPPAGTDRSGRVTFGADQDRLATFSAGKDQQSGSRNSSMGPALAPGDQGVKQ
jgi:hypothetical protein